MRLGKLDNDKLNELILSKFHKTRPEVLNSPKIGLDCAGVRFGTELAVLSSDPITAASNRIGYLTVHINCNDAATAGAEPIGLLVTLLAPPTTTEAQIAEIADSLAAAAKNAGVDIIGGHTEITDAVNGIVTSATVIAKTTESAFIKTNNMSVGEEIVMTKSAGLEGTAIIAMDHSERLVGVLTEDEIKNAIGFIDSISVVKEGLFAAKHGATAMHDVTEGGVLGAVWEMCDAAGVGCVVDKSAIPVQTETIKVCNALGVDPYRLISSGAMLIACKDGKRMADELSQIGIPACVIAKIVEKGISFTNNEEIAPPGADELYIIKKS